MKTAVPLLLLLAAQHIAGIRVELNDALARSYADRPASSDLATGAARTPPSPLPFFTSSSEPLPASLLMTVDGYYGDSSDHITCSVDETKRERSAKPVTVLLAISKCLNDSSLQRIESWVADMKDQEYSYFQDGVESPIEFAATAIPGSCQERSERNKHGLEDASTSKLEASATDESVLFQSEDVLEGDLARLAGFASLGRVLSALPKEGEEFERPIAVVGFVNNWRSYDEVERYERTFKVSKAFNFQLCDGGANNCTGRYAENCIFLKESVDLFLYSPFTVTNSYSCEAQLEGGIPVGYVQADSKTRGCFCACPAGSELQEGVGGKKFCVKSTCGDSEASCSWNTHPFGFKHEVAAPLATATADVSKQCKFSKIASDWGVPVPFPSDNYVADARTNAQDDKDTSRNERGPHIKVTTHKLPSQVFDGARMLSLSALGDVGLFERRVPPPSVVELLNLFAVGDVSHHLRVPPPVVALSDEDKDKDGSSQAYTWTYYMSHRRAVIDALSFTAYGKYALSLDATDYAGNATCTGCLAIVDKFRPRATTKCPSGFKDKDEAEPCAELSSSSVQKAQALVQGFFQFGDDAENDACSSDSTRCDDQALQLKDFFETSYSDVKAARAKKAFNEADVRSELLKALTKQKNPLAKPSDQTCATQETTPVSGGVCKRCVKLSTALQEFWTDYTCGYEYDVQKCEGDASQKCALEQCLVANGKSIATASAKVKSDAAKKAKDLGATAATEIRYQVASGCSSFTSSSCQYKTKLFKVIETSVSASAKSVLSGGDAAKVVFWRYRVKSTGEWKLWRGSSDDDEEAFSKETTNVFFEAWTPCGIVTDAAFSVVLVLPKPSSSYGKYAFSMLSALLNAGGATGVASAGTGADDGEISLAAGSSLVALAVVAIALVVVAVKRRRSKEEAAAAMRVDMDDDAYHPLLHY